MGVWRNGFSPWVWVGFSCVAVRPTSSRVVRRHRCHFCLADSLELVGALFPKVVAEQNHHTLCVESCRCNLSRAHGIYFVFKALQSVPSCSEFVSGVPLCGSLLGHLTTGQRLVAELELTSISGMVIFTFLEVLLWRVLT